MSGYRETRRELIRDNGGYANLFRLYADRSLRVLLRASRANGGRSLGFGVEVPADADDVLIRELVRQNVVERLDRMAEKDGACHAKA